MIPTQLTQLVVAVGGVNLLVGAAFTAAVYAALERMPTLAGVFGFLLAAAVVATEAHLGELLFSVTVAEMKLLVIAGVLGAALGITSFTTLFEPTIDGGR